MQTGRADESGSDGTQKIEASTEIVFPLCLGSLCHREKSAGMAPAACPSSKDSTIAKPKLGQEKMTCRHNLRAHMTMIVSCT